MRQSLGKHTCLGAQPPHPAVPCAWLPATLLPASCCHVHPLQLPASAVLQSLPLALCTAGACLRLECCLLEEGHELSCGDLNALCAAQKAALLDMQRPHVHREWKRGRNSACDPQGGINQQYHVTET